MSKANLIRKFNIKKQIYIHPSPLQKKGGERRGSRHALNEAREKSLTAPPPQQPRVPPPSHLSLPHEARPDLKDPWGSESSVPDRDSSGRGFLGQALMCPARSEAPVIALWTGPYHVTSGGHGHKPADPVLAHGAPISWGRYALGSPGTAHSSGQS